MNVACCHSTDETKVAKKRFQSQVSALIKDSASTIIELFLRNLTMGEKQILARASGIQKENMFGGNHAFLEIIKIQFNFKKC